MNTRFWNSFSDDWQANCLAWQHCPANPVVPPGQPAWKSRWTANPHFFELEGRLLLAYRGNGEVPHRPGELHDRIAIAEVLSIGPEGLSIRDLNGGSFAIDCGAVGEFDDQEALDPAPALFKGQVWLYYSAVGTGQPDSLGLATSPDGEHFTKRGQVMVGRAPTALVRGERLYMAYQLQDEQGNYVPVLASTEDGFHFEPVGDGQIRGLILPGTWASLSVGTMRLYDDGDWAYLLYGGSSYLADEPDFFGLARSKDLLNWEQHPGNPIFGCGPKGAADGGAIWSAACIEREGGFALVHEGSPGKYSWALDSHICLSWLKKG